MTYTPQQEAEDFALINYLYRNGYGGNEVEDYDEDELQPAEPWQEMGPAPEVGLPEEAAPYLYPYSELEAQEEADNVPYGAMPAKRQYLSFVPGNKRSGSDFYPYAYGPDGRWGAMVAEEEAMEKRAEDEMYSRLMRLAAQLRDRRDAIQAGYAVK